MKKITRLVMIMGLVMLAVAGLSLLFQGRSLAGLNSCMDDPAWNCDGFTRYNFGNGSLNIKIQEMHLQGLNFNIFKSGDNGNQQCSNWVTVAKEDESGARTINIFGSAVYIPENPNKYSYDGINKAQFNITADTIRDMVVNSPFYSPDGKYFIKVRRDIGGCNDCGFTQVNVGPKFFSVKAIKNLNAYSKEFTALADKLKGAIKGVWVFYPAQEIYNNGDGWIYLKASGGIWMYLSPADQLKNIFPQRGSYYICSTAWYVYPGQQDNTNGAWAGTNNFTRVEGMK